MKGSWSTATFFFNILGALSVLLLFDRATNFGWVSVIDVILSYYEFIKNFILSPIKPVALAIIKALSGFFQFELNLLDHWSDVFVLVTLYLGARMRSYWNSGMKRRAIFRAIWGAIVGLLTGIGAGIIQPFSVVENLEIVAIVVAGLAVFDIIDAGWAATFHRKAGLSWWQDWVRYAKFSMPSILLGIVFVILVYFTYPRWAASWIEVPGIVAVLVYSILLALYWLYRGFKSAQSWEKKGTGYEKFIASSNSQIGILMLRSLGAAGIVVLFSAGWSLAQP